MSHQSGRGRLDFDRLAQLFHSWPNSREYHISECDKVRVYYFGHNSGSFCINVIDIFLNLSLQIFLPYDILGIFWTHFRDRLGGAYISKFRNWQYGKPCASSGKPQMEGRHLQMGTQSPSCSDKLAQV